MTVTHFSKGNVHVRVQPPPGQNIQCQVELSGGVFVVVCMDLPEKKGMSNVSVRIVARLAGAFVFEAVEEDEPAWMESSQRILVLRLIKEATKRVPLVWENPTKAAALTVDLFVAALEKARSSAIN